VVAQQKLVDHHFEQDDWIKCQLSDARVALVDRLPIDRIDLTFNDFGVIILVEFVSKFMPRRGAIRDRKRAILFLIIF
jgi:hypothetical protein